MLTVPRLFVCAASVTLLLTVPGCGGDDSGTTGPGTPSVNITSPANGATVSGGVTLAVSAEHCDVVRFLVDGAEIGEDSAAPYETSWNSGSVANGAHTITARGEGGGGTDEDSITLTVANPVGSVVVTVAPTQATVPLGGSVQFTATVTGAADTAVDWSLDGTGGRGVISTAGLYTAPLVLPSPALVTVRATSRADASKSATATVTVTDDGGNGVTEAEKALSRDLFNIAHRGSDLGTDAVSLAAEAVWGASELAGQGVLTGTLTQLAPGSNAWTYSPQPADRLLVVFSGGPTFEFVFTTFDGYLEGTWEDFVDAHILDFTVKQAGAMDLRVQSDRYYVDGAEVPYTWKSEWTRRVMGTALYSGAQFTLDITHTGTQQGYTESGYAGLENEERILGQATSPASSMTLDEYYWATYLHDSNIGHIVRNWQMTVNSGTSLGGADYAYDMASARWEASSLINDPGRVNVVREPGYWQVTGVFRKDGAAMGSVEFDGPVIAETSGPDLILLFTGGETVVLHTLVPDPGE